MEGKYGVGGGIGEGREQGRGGREGGKRGREGEEERDGRLASGKGEEVGSGGCDLGRLRLLESKTELSFLRHGGHAGAAVSVGIGVVLLACFVCASGDSLGVSCRVLQGNDS